MLSTLGFDHVLVIGNGFDLSLGLPTSYSDFMESDQFQFLLEAQNGAAQYLRGIRGGNLWVDIESELVTYSSHSKNRTEAFQNEYIRLREALSTYINGIDTTNLNEECDGVKVLYEVAGRGGSLCVINFNYTQTVRILLENIFKASEIVHVHGEAKGEGIVFGVHDDAPIEKNHVFLRKGASEALYDQYLVGVIMKNSKRSVTIYGHSLGLTDHTQFFPFFSQKTTEYSSCCVEIHYYSVASYYELYEQMDALTRNSLQEFRALYNFEMIGPEL